jgi:hypothetical protein
MVTRALLAAGLCLVACSPAGAADIDLAAWVQTLPQQVHVTGSKVEPTYVAAIEVQRDGNVFSILGGAPAWMERSRETIGVDDAGVMRHLECPKGMDCAGVPRPAGLLSMAALIAKAKASTLTGRIPSERYGAWQVVCVPAETLGVAKPILDPCFDLASGVAIAQKNRFSGRFDGPSLDPLTLRISIPAKSVNTKEKAI